MAVRLSLLVLLGLLGGTLAKDYAGHMLIRVKPTTTEQVDFLKKMARDNVNLDFWTDPALNRPVDFNVSPEDLEETAELLSKANLPQIVLQQNIKRLLDTMKEEMAETRRTKVNKYLSKKYPERSTLLKGTSRSRAPRWLQREAAMLESNPGQIKSIAGQESFILNSFARHNDILDFLEDLPAKYPDIASIDDIGTTWEGRTQRVVKIGKAKPGGSKPVIWVDSNIHSREWLTSATSVWIIEHMLSNYGSDTEITTLIDYYDWHFLPVANPDGYEYSHTSERLWRKTRRPNSGYSCRGTDPNRNWDAEFGGAGTSTYPCSDTYHGGVAFSEPCTANMRDAIQGLAHRMELYVAIHSYSQMWLTPWGCCTTKPADYEEVKRVGEVGNDALMARHGKSFELGTPPDILYEASGGAYDWVKSKMGVKYAYTLELRPDSGSWGGFVVSESEITPSGQEVWAGLAAMAKDLKN